MDLSPLPLVVAFELMIVADALAGASAVVYLTEFDEAARAEALRNIGALLTGGTDERVDWIGTPERLNELLEVADILLISAPFTRATYGLIGAAELRRMKDDAILVNVARGEIVQERPLYDHLVGHPRFTDCIDAWWIEPVRHGAFRIDQPFLDLPNVIASPHNSAQGGDAHDISLRRAVENCRRALTGEAPLHVIGLDERLM
jgi:phosphoglycerate dehydrogenase-like enzyme